MLTTTNTSTNTTDLLKRLAALDTTCVSDALDKLGLPGGLLGIKPVFPGNNEKNKNNKKICGEAFTVHYVPCGQVKGTVGDFLDDVKPGQIVAIDNGGRDYCTVWGDIMAVAASRMGVGGTIIDGVCRDIPAIAEVGYPIFSKGYYMVTGKDRVEVDYTECPISMSGVRVCPGDAILGDGSGVVVVPREALPRVLEIAEEIDEVERRIIAEVENGSTLKAARAKLNYHRLQSKESA